MRACEYNIEILKNQNENLQTELNLVKKQLEKQKKYSSLIKSKAERLEIDLESYKHSGKHKPQKLQVKTAQGDIKNSLMMMDINDSFILKDSLAQSFFSFFLFLE